MRSYDHDALVFAGGVSNTDETSLNYLERAVFYMHESIGIAFHSYHTTAPPEEPHEPFASREAEMQRLLSITRDRFLALTELGRHTAPQKRGFWCFSKKYQETDADVAQYLEWEIKFFAKYTDLIVVYQHRDGPSRNWSENNFGMLRTDGSKKPIAENMPRISSEIA